MARRLILPALLLLTGLPLLAQQGPDGDPDAAQGYVDNVFHHSQIDSINLYNGQLTVPVAIGPSYPIGPKLKLQLAMTYASRVWEYGRPRVQNPNGLSAVLAGDPALGIGWAFTLGAIKSCGYQRTCYFGPDGSEHDFSVSSQFLLQNLGASGYEMWDGDGNHYVFGWHVSGFDDTLTDYRHDFGRGRDGWYLTSLTDPFGNGFSVSYRTGLGPCWTYATSCTYQAMQCPSTSMNLWIPEAITLPTSPNNIISVQVDTARMISGFNFPVSGGGSATWTLGYQPTTIPWSETCGGDLPRIQPDLRAIQSIELPDGIGSYQFAYDNAGNCSVGYLTHMQVPTGATVDYLYGAYAFYHGRLAALNQNCSPIAPDPFATVEVSGPAICGSGQQANMPMIPPAPCDGESTYLDHQRGVVRRTETVSGSSSVTDYKQYAFPFGEQGTPTNNCDALGRCGPQNLTVMVFPPDVDGRRHAKGVLFWSAPKRLDQTGVYAGERTGADIEERVYDIDPTQNVSIAMPVCGGTNLICAEHAVRVTQRTFDYDNPSGEIGNRRLRLEKTYYGPMLADGTCPDCAFHQVSYSNSGSSTWRGNGGHYNVETHTGNLGNDGLVITTSWSPTVSPWLPNLFDKRITTIATGSLNQYFDYDHSAEADGFLRGVLTWDSGRSLLFGECRYRETSQAVSDTHGNVASSYTATFPFNTEPDPHSCTVLRPDPASWEDSPGNGDVFATDFTYQNGQRVSARPVNGSSPGDWLSYDVTRDPKTGWITSSRDSAGLQTGYLYDAVGRVTEVSPPDEAAITISYPSAVQTIATRDTGEGLSTDERYDYDGLGRKIRERRLMPGGTYAKRFSKFDPAGNGYFVSEWVDDATSETVTPNLSTNCSYSGGTFSTSRPTGAPGTYQLCYDPFGRPRKVVGSMHSSLQTVSRVDGLSLYSDTLGSVTTSCVNGTYTGGTCSGGTDSTLTTRFDAFGRSTSVKEPNALTTWYGYDVNGKLTSVSQGGQSRSFSYDKAGFLRGETTPEKGTVSYGSIGSLGNVRQLTEPGGRVVSRTFDYAGRLTGVTSDEPRTYLTNTYDEANDGAVSRGSSLGKLTTSTASNYYPSTGYDFAFFPGGEITDSFHYSGVGGRLSLKKTTISNGAVSPIASWTYNRLGLVETEYYPRIDPSSTPFAVTTGYTSGFPTAVTANGQQVVTAATYDPAGGLASYTSGIGITTTITPDPSRLPRPRQISTSNSIFDSGLYSYDGAGNIKSIGADDFTYDSNSRLLSAEYSSTTQNYTYDRWGNLTQKAGTAIPVNAATNHLTAATYDLRGNLASLAGENYSYDALNRQARHEAPTSHWNYLFDAANERIVKAIPPSNGTTVLRRDMARTILQAMDQKPAEACAGTFVDVPCGDPDRGWIERFSELGITSGCAGLPNRQFCPNVSLTRAEMAVFLAVALAGPAGVPASGTAFGNPYDCNLATPPDARRSLFGDVPVVPDVAFACSHIHYIYARGITSGCTTGALNFCPGLTTNHLEMEVFESVAWAGFAYVPPGATYTFRGAGSSILTEYQDSTVSKDYVYLGASLVGTRDAGGWKYHTTDHLGSVRLTMSADGDVERRKYWPWGEEAGTTGVGRMAFAGMELDLEASRPRYYDHARNIETGIGRFLSPDMLSGHVADPQSWNRYTYARNNPLRFTDPTGMMLRCGYAGPDDPGSSLACTESTVVTARDPQITPDWGVKESAIWAGGMNSLASFTDYAEAGLDFAATATLPLAAYGSVMGGARLIDGLMSAGSVAGETQSLFRAVGPGELVDIQSTGAIRPSPGGLEGKYFSTTAEGASRYAQMAVRAFGDRPYTLVETSMSRGAVPMAPYLDGGIPTVVVPNQQLPMLGPVRIWPFMPRP